MQKWLDGIRAAALEAGQELILAQPDIDYLSLSREIQNHLKSIEKYAKYEPTIEREGEAAAKKIWRAACDLKQTLKKI